MRQRKGAGGAAESNRPASRTHVSGRFRGGALDPEGANGTARSRESLVASAPVIGERIEYHCAARDHEADATYKRNRDGVERWHVGNAYVDRCPGGRECLAMHKDWLGVEAADLLSDPRRYLPAGRRGHRTVMYDVGEEVAAATTVGKLRSVEAEAFAVYLPLPRGGDLNDWFVKYGRNRDDLVALIRRGSARG